MFSLKVDFGHGLPRLCFEVTPLPTQQFFSENWDKRRGTWRIFHGWFMTCVCLAWSTCSVDRAAQSQSLSAKSLLADVYFRASFDGGYEAKSIVGEAPILTAESHDRKEKRNGMTKSVVTIAKD